MTRIAIPTYESNVMPDGPMAPAAFRGGQLTDAVGQGMQQLGQAGQGAAEVLQRRQDQQGWAWANNAASQFKLQQYQKFQNAKDSAPNGGDGLTQNYLESYDKDANEVMDSAPTPRARKFLDMHLATFRTQIGEQSIREEQALGKSYAVGQMTDAVNNSGQLIGAPGGARNAYQSELTTQLAAIQAMQQPPEVKQALKAHAQKTLTDAYWTSYIRDNPDEAAQILKGQLPPQATGSGSIPDKIKAEAASAGVDPRVALGIAQVESNLDPTAKNPKSSASGVFQQIDSTFGAFAPEGADKSDPDVQVKAGIKGLAANQKALTQTLARAPTPGEQYMAHVFGIGGVGAILKAPDATPVRDVVAKYDPQNADQIVANNGMAGQTVGQAKAMWNAVIAKGIAKTKGLADAPALGQPATPPDDPVAKMAIANTPVPQQLAYLTHAESMARKDDSQARAEVEGRFNDAAAANANGESSANAPTLPELVTHFGAVKGAQMFQQQSDREQFSHTYAGMKTMSDGEIDQALQNAKADPSTPGYAEKSKIYNALQLAAQRTRELRVADPAQYAIGTGLMQPLDMSSPDKLVGTLSVRLNQAQEVSQRYGTAYAPLSKEEATSMGNLLQGLPPAQAQDYLGKIRWQAGTDPSKYMALMSQVAQGHPTLAVAGQINDKNPTAAGYMIVGDRILNPSKTDKEAAGGAKLPIPEDGGAGGFRQAFENAVGAAYGGNTKSYEQDLQAAKAYYVGVQPAGSRSTVLNTRLFAQAIAATTGGVDQHFGPNFPPYGMPPEQFPNAVQAAWPAAMEAAGLSAAEHPASAYTLQGIADGRYLVNAGASNLKGSDGRPVVLDLSGVAQQTTAQPSLPPQPMTKQQVKEDYALRNRTARIR